MITHQNEEHGETTNLTKTVELTANKYCVEYAKTGNAKCYRCKKIIGKNVLRIDK